jgi:hypothetical protein
MAEASGWLDTAGFWLGLLVTLLILSGLAGDNALARLGQHLLVGAALGYGAVLAVQHVLRPRLVAPLLAAPVDPVRDPAGALWQWAPLALGVLLLVAGLDRTWRPARAGVPLPRWRRLLHGLGRVPVAFLLGVGLAAGLVGTLQGTFFPQFWRAAALAFDPAAPGLLYLIGVLTLLITTATLLYLYVDPDRYLAEQPAAVRRLLHGWLWVGQRAVWLAAGLIFARLLASRLSLLIGRVEYILEVLAGSPAWRWAASTWLALIH